MSQKSSSTRIKRISTKSAVMLVSSVIREFLEKHPSFNLSTSIPIVSFKESELKNKDNDHIQRLMLRASQAEALLDKKVQERVAKFVLKTYPQVKSITIKISEEDLKTHVDAVCEIATTPK